MAITKTKAATRCHIKSVISDPDFIDKLAELNKLKDKGQLVSELLKEFGLSFDDFSSSDNGFALHANPYTLFSAGLLEIDENNTEFTARFDSGVTRQQFEELWQLIRKNKKHLMIPETKLKNPEDPDLLYAIFKAKKRTTSYREIFEQYSTGNLPLYSSKKISRFPNQFRLERYFEKYYKLDF